MTEDEAFIAELSERLAGVSARIAEANAIIEQISEAVSAAVETGKCISAPPT